MILRKDRGACNLIRPPFLLCPYLFVASIIVKMKKCSLRFRLTVLVCFGAALAGCGGSRTASPKDPAKLGVRISPEGTKAAEPAIVADAAGNALVAYVEHNGKAGDLFIQKLDRNGKLEGDRVRVNPSAGEAKAWKGDPPALAVGTDGTIFVSWTRALPDPEARGNDLVLSISKDSGHSFGAPAKINDDEKPASHGMHSLAVDDSGRVFAAWLDERNIKYEEHSTKTAGAAMHHEEKEPNSEVYYSYSRDGGKTFLPNRKIATEVCPCCKTAVLAASDGTVYVSWRQVLKDDFRHIAVSHSNDNGETFSPGVIVSDDKWQINACPVSGASMASGGPQTLEVLWFAGGTEGDLGIYFTRSTDGGRTFDARTIVDDNAIGGTPVLLTNGSKPTAVFTGADERVYSIETNDTPTDGEATAIADGSLPSATYLNGKLATAFVRNTNSKSEVWFVVS